MYAWRKFERGEEIGMYSGTRLGPFDAGDEDAIAGAIHALPAGHRDKVVEVTVDKGRKVELVDGTDAGPPFLPRANDAYRMQTQDGKNRSNTAYMDTGGRVGARTITGRRPIGRSGKKGPILQL